MSHCEISDKENLMNMAEQSLSELSAPHGAPFLPCESRSHIERSRAFAASHVTPGHVVSGRSASRLAPSIIVAGLLIAAPLALAVPATTKSLTSAPRLSAPRSHLLPVSAPLPSPRVSSLPLALKPIVTKPVAVKTATAKPSTTPSTGPVALTVGASKVVKVAQNVKVEGNRTNTPDAKPDAKPQTDASPPEAAPVEVSATPASLAATSVGEITASPSTEVPSANLAGANLAGANLEGMKHVIRAAEVAPSQLAKPLSPKLRSVSVRVETLEKQVPPAAPANRPRFAQNIGGSPVRQPARPVTNSDRLSNQIEVSVSTFVVLVTTSDLQTVAVADPTIADVAVVNSRAVLLNGKSDGTTSLVIVDGQKIRQYRVRVMPSVGSQTNDINAAIGIPGVTARQIKDAVVLQGEVASDEESKQAASIAAIFTPKVVNQLAVRSSPVVDTSTDLQDKINIPGVRVSTINGTIVLSGTAPSPADIQDAEAMARTAGKPVLNQLRLPPLTVDQLRESIGANPLIKPPVGDVVPDGAPGVIPVPPAGTVPGVTGPGIPPLDGTAQGVIAGVGGIGQLSVAAPLTVREVGGQVVLEGQMPNQGAIDLALANAARTGLPIVNRLSLALPLSSEQQFANVVATAINMPGVTVSGTPKRLVLRGIVADTNAAVAAEQIARGYAPEVDVLLQTPNPLLVDVDIKIAEVTTSALKSLGFQFPTLQDAGNGFVIGQTVTRGPFQVQSPFQAALRAEITNQNVRLLSEPHTTVLSGRTATFQVGGQVPVPVSITQTATGTVTGIAFKDYGVLVDVIPNASANGNVTMRLRTEVSQPDTSTGFTPFAGASIIPGFTRRSTVTEVTIPQNGTLALGGLISRENRRLVSKLPVLGNLPIIGSLFQSRRFVNNQTELIIFVTPHVLPNPLANGTTSAAGVVAAGNTTNAGTILGNPGIPVFNSGITIAGAGTGSGGGQ